MLAFATAILASLALTASAAIAPRASPAPGDSFYRPPYACAASIDQFGTTLALASSDYRTDSNSLNCQYGDDIMNFCSYDTTTGASTFAQDGCPATLGATSGCIYECSLKETGGTDLLEAIYQVDGSSLQCEYWAGGQWLFCFYDGLGALSGHSGESTGHSCPQTASYQCDAGPTRRSYRGSDNYTAWLARRAARKARDLTPAAPAPAAAPIAERAH